MRTFRELEKSLTNQTPDIYTIETIETLRAYGKDLGCKIIDLLPESREKSIALTKLEECVMWAVKSAVMHQESE